MPNVTRVCMLSVHGCFDAVPILGATDTGGQVTYVLDLSRALSELGVSVDIFTRRFEDRPETDAVNDAVRVVRVPCGGPEFIRKEDLFPHLDEFTRNAEAYVRAHDLRYDLVHGHYWDAGYAGMNLAGALGLPFIFTAHSLGAWKKEQMGGDPETMEKLFNFSQRIRWENVIFRRAAAQTVTTADGKETYRRLYGFESDDLVVIPPGVDVRRFRPSPPGGTPPPAASGDFVFSLSRIDSNKGLDYLIRGFDRVRRESGARLVIGGGSKNPRAHEVEVKRSLAALVDELSLGDRVTFTGYVPDAELNAYYQSARVFVLPSMYEPFGMVLLEAMACGTPVVAARHAGLGHVLTHGRDGLLVDPSDPHELSAAILEILNDDALARRLGEAGLALVRDRFTWQRIARKTLDFYARYASGRRESF